MIPGLNSTSVKGAVCHRCEAKESAICPKREAVYSEAFDGLIKQANFRVSDQLLSKSKKSSPKVAVVEISVLIERQTNVRAHDVRAARVTEPGRVAQSRFSLYVTSQIAAECPEAAPLLANVRNERRMVLACHLELHRSALNLGVEESVRADSAVGVR